MAVVFGCQLDCDTLELFKEPIDILKAVLRQDGNDCFYLDVRDGSGGTSGGAQIINGVIGGDGSTFQDSGLIGKTQLIVLVQGNSLVPGDYDNTPFDDVSGTITFDSNQNPGDSIQIIAV